MTMRRDGLPLFFLLVGMFGAGLPDEKSNILSEQAIYDALAKEMKEILDDGKRFTLLPANIVDVHVSPRHAPCFVMSRRDYSRRAEFGVTLESIRKNHGNFRLSIDGRIVGWGSDDRMAIVNDDGSKGAIVERENARMMALPRGVNIRRAEEVGGRWMFETSAGFATNDGRILVKPEEGRTMRSVMVPDKGSVVILDHPASAGTERRNVETSLTFVSERGAEKWTYAGVLRGVVRSRDGGWIALGEKILPLVRDREKSPPDEKITAALKAVEEVRMKDLSPLLEELTSCDHRHLAGLARQMQYKRSTVVGYRETELKLQSLLSTIENMRPPEMPGREEQRKKIVELLDGYKAQGRKTVEDLRKIMAEDPAIAMGNAGDRIVQGYQYSGGLWFKDAQIIEQTTPDSATVVLSYDDGNGPGVRKGVFSVDGDGRVTFIAPLPVVSRSVDLAEDGDGNFLAFAQGEGLARLSKGTCEWLDRSDRMKRMERLIGCDMAGRVYFGPQYRREDEQRWIYRIGGTVDEAADVKRFPIHGHPATDGDGGLWFVGQQEPVAEATPVTFAEGGLQESDFVGPTEGGPALYRYADGALRKYLRHPSLADGRLLGGKGKTVIFIAPPAAKLAMAIKDDVVYAAKGIHELVTQRFDLLMEVAPDRLSPDRYRSTVRPQRDAPQPRPSLLRIGDLLWVCDGVSIEAYRKGRALSVGKRLELQGAKMINPAVIGPLGANKRVLLACTPQRITDYFWATPGEDGIALERTECPESRQGDIYLGGPEIVSWPPLVDFERGSFFCSRGFNDFWEVTGPKGHRLRRDGGEPRFLMKDHRLLAYRETREYYGYRLVSGETTIDIAPTYVKNLYALREEDAGVLLFAGPDGLVRLTPDGKGGYDIGTTVRYDFPGFIDGYLGESNGAYLLTVRDNKIRFVVIVPKK